MPLDLPDVRNEKVILLHLQLDGDGTDAILQIPPKDRGKRSNTYSLDLSEPKDFAWISGLKNGKILIDRLRLHGHVAFFPSSGASFPLEDKFIEKLSAIQEARQLVELEKNEGPLNKWSGFPVGARQVRPTIFGKR